FRLFAVRLSGAFDGALTLRSLTLRGGRVQSAYATGCGGGGALMTRSAPVTLDRVTLRDNVVAADSGVACGGGAIFANASQLTVTDSAILDNRSGAGDARRPAQRRVLSARTAATAAS